MRGARNETFGSGRPPSEVRTVTSVDSTLTDNGTAATPRNTLPRLVRDPATLLNTATAVAAGLSVTDLRWTVPTAVTAFLAGRRPGRTAPTALALLAVLAAGVTALAVVPAWLPLAGRFVAVVVAAMMLPWFAGRFWCQYRQLVRAGWERAGQLQREQQLIADQARLRERTRIAQDMHDVLGHDLSLIALSAGALKLAPDLAEHHQRAAADIRARAAGAVERLGEVIGVLREETGATPVEPDDPGLTRLTSEASEAGLPVELCVDGEADDLPPVVARAAHRVVQEALTNVLKHAPGADAAVELAYRAGEVTVSVTDGGPAGGPDPVTPAEGGGHGLIGMRERAKLYGGTIAVGPRSEGGFGVRLTLPTPVQVARRGDSVRE